MLLYFVVLSGQFFFLLSVSVPRNNLIRGPFGSTSGHTFYMSMQNGSKLEVWPDRILIHALELKLWHFEVFPICLYREAMHLQCFTPTRYVSGRGHAHICTWRPLPDLLKIAIEGACLHYRALLCAVALSPGIVPSFAVLHTEKLAFQEQHC